MAREFRVAYECEDSLKNELMQWNLVDEEFRDSIAYKQLNFSGN